jgi:uncharacterized protein
VNPFNYQGPAGAPLLIDRRAELDALQAAAADRIAVRLAAPRRFGKTSVLDAHVEAMRAAGHRAVRVDLSRVATVADVAARVAQAYQALGTDPRRTVRRWIASLGVGVKAGPLSVRVPPRPAADDARAALLELLDVPRAFYEDDGGLTVVCLDEFQDLLVADPDLDGLVRSVIQHHGKAAAYVYAGSAPSLMRALFADRERPLFGQARPLDLPPLPTAETAEDVLRIAAEQGVALDPDDVRRVVDLCGGHPQRTMLVAHHLFELTAAGEDAPDLAGLALEHALAETADVHRTVWDSLSRADRAVIAALADGLPPTGTRAARLHSTARATMQKALERLVAAEQHVVAREEGPVIVDPLFAIWLARRGRTPAAR